MGTKALSGEQGPFAKNEAFWTPLFALEVQIGFSLCYLLLYLSPLPLHFCPFRQLYIYCYKILDLGQRGEGENKIFRNPSVDALGQKYEGSKNSTSSFRFLGGVKGWGRRGEERNQSPLLLLSSVSRPNPLFLFFPLTSFSNYTPSSSTPTSERKRRKLPSLGGKGEERRKSCHGLVGCPEEQSKTPSFFPVSPWGLEVG